MTMSRDWSELNMQQHCAGCDCRPAQPTPAELLAAIHLIHATLNRMEMAMATAKQQLDDLTSRFDDFTGDVRAALDTLTQERENLTPDGQAALDNLNAKLAAADAEVGDADGSDTPAEPTDPNA